MPITIKFASWNIENYGSKKNAKSPELPKLIARTMELNQIDILAILEMQNNGYQNIHTQIITALNNTQHYSNQWYAKFVNVGDEGVSFFWHEGTAGANAFKAKRYPNSTQVIAEKVLRDSNGRIYFPKTQTSWSSLPGKPDGRRPAFCAFETNAGGGATPTTFTFLDIHTPFNTSTLIQAYSAFLYSTSREITQVPESDSLYAVRNNTAQQTVENVIANEFPGSQFAQARKDVATAAIGAITDDRFIDRWRDEIVAGDFQKVAQEAAKVAAASAAQKAKDEKLDSIIVNGNTLGEEGIAKFGAVAGAAAATYIVAEAMTNNNDPNNDANTAAKSAVNKFSYTAPPKKQKTSTGISSAVKSAAEKSAEDGVNTITFSSMVSSTINASALAGDFNIDYPDKNDYSKVSGASKYITTSDGAYGDLLKLPSVPAIDENTTQRGGKEHDDFSGARVYKLKNPVPPQPSGVPDEVYKVYTNLKSTQGYAPYENWEQALKTEASNKNVSWSDMLKYENDINNAFDSTTDYNNTEYFRASAYDNIFVKNPGSAISPGSGESIDVLSELGNWSADTSAGNFWPAAQGNLNAIANIFLTDPNTPTPTGINVNLQSAADAAAFYKVYMSDHYPVFVEVTIP